MGAALTYARRYALFTLAGIAGEDDLDGPDLAIQTVDSGPEKRSAGRDFRSPPPLFKLVLIHFPFTVRSRLYTLQAVSAPGGLV